MATYWLFFTSDSRRRYATGDLLEDGNDDDSEGDCGSCAIKGSRGGDLKTGDMGDDSLLDDSSRIAIFDCGGDTGASLKCSLLIDDVSICTT